MLGTGSLKAASTEAAVSPKGSRSGCLEPEPSCNCCQLGFLSEGRRYEWVAM